MFLSAPLDIEKELTKIQTSFTESCRRHSMRRHRLSFYFTYSITCETLWLMTDISNGNKLTEYCYLVGLCRMWRVLAILYTTVAFWPVCAAGGNTVPELWEKQPGCWRPRHQPHLLCYHSPASHQAVSQSIYQSINQSLNQSINQSITQSLNHSIMTLQTTIKVK